MSQNVSTTADARTLQLEIKNIFGGQLPNAFQAYMQYPPLLAANWEKYKAIMLQGRLRRKVKGMIASLVSYDNNCKYCVAAHTAVLRHLGMTETEVGTMLQGKLPEDITEQEAALIAFARKANTQWHDIDAGEKQKLFDMGISNTEMIEALGTMELFIAFNRYIDIMEVEIDF